MKLFGLGRRFASCSAVLLLAAVGLSSGSCASHGAADLTPAQIAAIAIPSVVLIRTSAGLGSGFVASDDGKIVTNFHVIRGAKSATVITSGHAEFHDVSVVSLDPSRDLAILQVRGLGLKKLALADSSLVQPGEHVVAIGNPLGLGNTVSDGLLSGIRQLPRLSVLQISAPISPGSSGGPVFNDRGEVIGVVTFLLRGGQNLNFAIAINTAKPMLSAQGSKPLAAYAGLAPARHIPDHPASFLNECPAPQLSSVIASISRAVAVGAPLYNQGNFEACYRVYEGAAADVQRTVQQCAGPKQALEDGASRAATISEWSAKSWAMRDAFDGIMKAAMRVEAAKKGIFIPERHVPDVPAAVVQECPREDLAGIAGSIQGAINSGAPLYNDGNGEACFRIYQGAVSEVDQKYARCPAARQVLHDGLHKADGLADYRAKAWALRDAFDGLVKAIAEVTDSTPQ